MKPVKVRINNSHKHIWAVVWNGQPEDFSDAKDITLIASVRDKRINLTQGIDYVIEGNLVKIDFTPRFCKNTGVYNIELNYTKPSESFLSGERRTAVDLNVIEIVGTSACADATDETSSVSEAAFGFQGLSAYEVWLKDNPGKTKEDYFAFLQKPATDAIGSIQAVEQTISENEGLRVSAESERDLAEGTRVQSENERLAAEIIRQSNEGNRIENEATRVQNEAERISEEGIRQSNEIDRIEAEGLRVQAESERVQAEVERQITIQEAVTATNLANEKANLANIAAQSANEAADSALTATQEATTAASLADTARLAIQDDLELKANQTDLVQLAGDVNLKELKANKQNSLAADGTGTKFPTVDAVNEGLQPKLVSGTNIKTVNGKSLLGSGDIEPNLIVELVYNSNREIIVDSVNVATSTFTRVSHGLINNNKIFPITNGSEGIFNGTNLTPYELYAGNLLQKTYWVVNATADTFQLSETQGGSVLVLAENAKMNLNAWHFEEVTTVSEILITGLTLPRRFRVEYDLRINSYFRTNLLQYYSNNWLTLGSTGYSWDIRYPLGTLSTLITVDYYFTDVNAKYISNRSCIYADNGTKTIKEISPSIEHYQSNHYNYSRVGSIIGINFYSNPQVRALANGSTIRVYKV